MLPYLHRSKKVTALATSLQNSSLLKRDLELELEELEKAAMMVQEEEEAPSRSAAVSHGNSRSNSGSSSDSSEPSESGESEAEGCTEAREEERGGGGGEIRQHSPPQPTSTGCNIPWEHANTPLTAGKETGAQPTRSQDSPQLIQELWELTITQEPHSSRVKQEDSSHTNSATAKSENAAGNGSTQTLIDLSPRKNPLLIVQEN